MQNDEVFVKMATEWQNSKPLYDAFKAHFGRATSEASSFAYADVAMLCPLQQVTLKGLEAVRRVGSFRFPTRVGTR